ncbi:MAG: NB-ARC domain-containing protein [Saprospiraceae bacterium]
MNEIHAFTGRIRALIAKDDLKEALRQLRLLLDNSPALDEVMHQSARLQDIRKQIRMGKMDDEQASLAHSRINTGIVELLRELESPEEIQPAFRAEVERAAGVVNSKNVVSGSTIQAGENVIIGDGNVIQQTVITYAGGRKIDPALTPNPFQPEYFLGRETDLLNIRDKFFSGEHFLLLVNGVGGVGKTALASRYYQTYQNDYTHTAWVLNEKNITNALLLLAAPLGVQFEEHMNAGERLEILLKALADLPRPCLLVIDNANESDDLEANYQKLRRCSNFHLLLTTRLTALANAATYPIDGLPEAEALQLFKKYYPRFKPEKEEAIFKEIRTAVDGNTLVVELLAKNLALFNRFKTNYTLAELLADLRQKGLLQLTQSQEVVTDYQSKAGVMRKEKPEAIISAMYDLGDLPEEDKALLSIFAVLPAESIPYEMLEALLPGIENLDKTLGSLVQKGWLAEQTGLVESTRGLESEPDLLEAEHAHFKCSPVIQEIVRLKNPDLRYDCQILVDDLIEKLDYEEGTGRLLNVTGSEALDFVRYTESVVLNLPEPTTYISKLADRVGSFHKATGNLDRALYHYQRKVQFDEALCVLEPDKLNSKRSLAISYSKHGSIYFHLRIFKQAIDLYELSHKIFKELYETYPQFKNELAISCERLGDSYLKSNNFEDALNFFTLYNQLKGELHESHPQDLDIKNGLAISYGKLGDIHIALRNWPQALIFFEKFNSLNEEVCEDDSQNMHYKDILGVSFEKLGDIHLALGNLDQALIFFKRANDLAKEPYSKSPQIAPFKFRLATSYAKLGGFYKDRGDKTMAKYYLEQSYPHLKELSETTSYAEYREKFEWVKNALKELNE